VSASDRATTGRTVRIRHPTGVVLGAVTVALRGISMAYRPHDPGRLLILAIRVREA
jgi:hypothetical protein